jgi:hypothetical protein
MLSPGACVQGKYAPSTSSGHWEGTDGNPQGNAKAIRRI